jgi:hypothetical protein
VFTNDTRLKLEVIGLLVIIAFVLTGVFQWHRNTIAEAQAKTLHEQQEKYDQDMKQRDKDQKDRDSEYAKRIASITSMTPQQIVLKVPDYISKAPEPMKVLDSNSAAVKAGEAKVGDVVVPKADVAPVAEKIVEGKKCSEDLISCKSDIADWTGKFKTKEKESDDWKRAAKGGSLLHRVWTTTWKIGIGVGIGYAIKH